ncbi:MAG: hypothetical protein A2W28_09185 [Gammaproteobacteria bacterium RBG_16_51_14]|nr:MAG: hypothetical protein A2W28_09185 [Gammaproteobacteria bacterium RBG_16_51_14]
MVFVLLFLPVLILSLLFLYKAGIVTSEKMQLQNAADAAAYSTSLIEARDLNYMAYTNRAMIANEVAIGQMVGLASWARNWKSYGDYLNAYDKLILAPLTLGASTAFITPLSMVFTVPGVPASSFMGTIAKVGAQVLSFINKIYGGSQTGFHIVSMLYAAGTIPDVIDKNTDDAGLSPFGILSLIGHMYTYGAIPGTPGSFIKTYSPTGTGESDIEGMERFAATARQSRDEFTQQRGWDFTLPIIPQFTLPISIPVWPLPPITADLEFDMHFSFVMRRLGGSELRYVGNEARGDKFNWSAADDTDVGLDFHFCIDFSLTVDLGPLGSESIDIFSACIAAGAGSVDLRGSIAGIDIVILDNLPFPTSIPFSGAAYQSGKSKVVDVAGEAAEHYGTAPSNRIAWLTGLPPALPITLQMPMATNQSSTYKGLPRYNDTVPVDDPWGFQAPFLFLGVTKDFDETNKTGPRPVGQFAMNYGEDGAGSTNNLTDELGAVAKSEVYFSRPSNPLDPASGYFGRVDGYTEYGSAFNPYWQARLAPTTHAERVVSLWLQQSQSFGTIAQTLNLGAWNPLDLIP